MLEFMAACLILALILAAIAKTRWTLIASAVLMAIATGLAVFAGQVLPIGLSLPAALLANVLWLQRSPWGWIGMLVLAAAALLHIWPGIYNPLWITEQTLGQSQQPYRQFLNIDKAWLGFALLLALRGRETWQSPRASESWLAITIIAMVLMTALFGGWLTWDPSSDKWPLFLRWASVNLVLTCLVEETLFRHGIQGQLGEWWVKRHRHGRAFACLLSALVFGLAHLAGGLAMVAFASLAGLAYGLAYRRHGLWAATGLHFGLNALHFALLSYPMP